MGLGSSQQKCHREARTAFAQEVGLLAHTHFMPTVCKRAPTRTPWKQESSVLWQGVCVKGNQRGSHFCKHQSFWSVPSYLVGYTHTFFPPKTKSPPSDFQSEGNKRNCINILYSWPIGSEFWTGRVTNCKLAESLLPLSSEGHFPAPSSKWNGTCHSGNPPTTPMGHVNVSELRVRRGVPVLDWWKLGKL